VSFLKFILKNNSNPPAKTQRLDAVAQFADDFLENAVLREQPRTVEWREQPLKAVSPKINFQIN